MKMFDRLICDETMLLSANEKENAIFVPALAIERGIMEGLLVVYSRTTGVVISASWWKLETGSDELIEEKSVPLTNKLRRYLYYIIEGGDFY